jgi:hypothetical protein
VPAEAALAAALAEAASVAPQVTASSTIPDPWTALAGWGR